MPNILFVEDDQLIAGVVTRWLQKEGMSVVHTDTVATAIDQLSYASFDLVILDWELPDGPGINVLEHLRGKGMPMPVLMLTAKAEMENKLQGFQSGADDYLTKPFDGRELMMRVQALLRRPAQRIGKELSVGEFSLDAKTHTLNIGGEVVALSRREHDLLDFLMRRQGQAIPAESILSTVWNDSEEVGTQNGLATCVTRLRKKLDRPEKANPLKNIYGVGYGFFP